MAKGPGSAASRRKTTRNAVRRKRAKKDANAVPGLPVFWADTAGIDIGATEIYVAVPADQDEEPVRCFGGFTEDLLPLVFWFQPQVWWTGKVAAFTSPSVGNLSGIVPIHACPC